MTDDVEKCFFKTLSCLKKGDPKIYDDSVKFFNSSSQQTAKISTSSKNNKGSNPVYLEEYKRNILLERGPEFDDTEEMNGKFDRKSQIIYALQKDFFFLNIVVFVKIN